MPIGQTLIAEGFLTEEQLAQALDEQKNTGVRLGELLVNERLVSPAVVVRALGRSLGVRGCVLRHGLIDPALLETIGEEEATRLKVIPMFNVHGTLTVAMAEPQAVPTIDALSRMTGCRIRPVLALESNILEFIKKYAAGGTDIDGFLATLTHSEVELVERETVDEGPTTNLDQMVEGSPIVNLVNLALLTAVKDGASDIHIEPDRTGTRVRYRIDGMLRELMHPPAGMHAAIVSRAKVMGKMDVAEKRVPQEGRIRIIAEGRDIDLRVSSMPTLLGEKMVIRILDKENLSIRLEELGFRTEGLAAFQRILRQPHGLGLVTGPTGSGKTTTLYSALDLLRSPELNIITVEDPVEYQLDLINQIQVHEAIGLTFARILRSVLRHHGRRDPRRGDRPRGRAGCVDRPPGAGHAPHERCAGSGRAAAGHGDRALSAFGRAQRRGGAASGANRVRRLRDQVLPRRAGPQGRGSRRQERDGVHEGRRL
jgi:type IV pilus assembly protein PilB